MLEVFRELSKSLSLRMILLKIKNLLSKEKKVIVMPKICLIKYISKVIQYQVRMKLNNAKVYFIFNKLLKMKNLK